MEKKTIQEVLAQMSVRIINEETTPELYEDVMFAEKFEEDANKHIFEFSAQQGEVEEWADDFSGKCYYCENLQEAVDALNEAINNGDIVTDEAIDGDKDLEG